MRDLPYLKPKYDGFSQNMLLVGGPAFRMIKEIAPVYSYCDYVIVVDLIILIGINVGQ